MSQRVLITAGASGIGLAIAKAFAAAGARVHIADIDGDAVSAVTQSDPRITGSAVDIGDAVSVQGLFEYLRQHFGGLDVLVNNAGIAGPNAAVVDYPDEAWATVVQVNLTGTFQVTKAAIPLLKESGQAAIIIMSSLAGRFGYPNRCAYATTKWGLVGFAKTLAMELGGSGITCNTIHPGAVAGPRMDKVLEGRAAAAGTDIETQRQNILALQSIKSFAEPDDIAALVMFLSGKHARTISGQAFPIDGDSKSTQ